MPKGIAYRYPAEHLAFIKAHCTLPRAELTAKVNSHFNTTYSVNRIQALCKRRKWHTGRDGRFYIGHQAWNANSAGTGLCKANAGSWSTENKPDYNRKPLGHERLTKDGYTMIKVAEPDIFRLKQHVIYEQHHGSIPDQHVIRFKDSNPRNFDIHNLVAVPRGVNTILNRKYRHYLAINEIKPVLLTMAQIDHKLRELSQ